VETLTTVASIQQFFWAYKAKSTHLLQQSWSYSVNLCPNTESFQAYPTHKCWQSDTVH